MKPGNNTINCPACLRTDCDYWGNKNGFELYKSKNCGLIFVWPKPNDTTHIYSRDYFSGATKGFGYTNYDQDKEPMRKVFLRYLKEIEKYLPNKGRLLDVGAASGYFMNLASTAGWQTSGVEVSEYAVALAKEKGLSLTRGTLENMSPAVGQFQVITLWDVLEHVPNPEEDIKKINKLLEIGGVVAINTPDSSSMGATLLGPRWHLTLSPEHLFLFNKKSLKIILERNGFEVLTVKKIGKIFSLPYIFTFGHGWTGARIFKWLGEFSSKGFLGKIGIPINLRDNIFVIARKIQ